VQTCALPISRSRAERAAQSPALPPPTTMTSNSVGIVEPLESHDSPPEVGGAPQTRPQTFEVDDLGVVDEEVHLRPELLHVPSVDDGIGRLEHDLVQTDLRGEPGGYLCPPLFHRFGHSLRLRHHEGRTGLEAGLGTFHRPVQIDLTRLLQSFGCAGATGPELDGDLGLGCQPSLQGHLDKTENVVEGNAEEPRRYLD